MVCRRINCASSGTANVPPNSAPFSDTFPVSSTTVETAAGVALILGLFTRFFAAAAAIELLIITMIYWKTGFAWTRRGYEYTLMWGLISFAIALRGGGPYSLDRKLGREL